MASGLYTIIVRAIDATGKIDRKEWEKEMRLGIELLPFIPDAERPRQVVNAQHRFAKRRYQHEFKWKPSREVEEAIVSAVFYWRTTVTKL